MAGTPPTISLTFIAKTQKQADAMVEKYGKYFDDVVYRTGTITDSFSDARNELLPKVKTEYWVWLDTDDDVDGIENLRPLAEEMRAKNLDAYYMPYEYAYNEQGECIVLQWRERLIRTSHPFKWMGAIHESLISTVKAPLLDRTEGMIIKHDKTAAEHTESAQRNHKILLKEYALAERDPRITHYLALSFFNLGNYKKSIKLFEEHIRTSGWDEDKYRSWFYIGQSYGLLNDNENVLKAATAGIQLVPSRPECYVLAATAELELRNFGKCIEWLKNASTKDAPSKSLSAIDPTYYGYKAEFLAAQAYLNLGYIDEAYAQMKLVLQHSPGFQPAVDLAPLFQEIHDDKVAVTRIQWLADYTKHYGGKPAKLLEALPPKLLSDPRLNQTRAEIYPSVEWSDKSIVFFCGQSAEPWGPDTLAQGMGGSEEAVLYLSRELAKLGWEVTIFNDRDEEYTDLVETGEKYDPEFRETSSTYTNVTYKPWTLFNPQDEFNVIIAWRNPGFFTTLPIKAKFKGVDMHDMPTGHQDIEQNYVNTVDKFFFKSEFQASLLELPPGKKAVISNGVATEQFNVNVKRQSHKVIYGSSADRGLECLVELWPRIKEQVPEAEVVWYYGWNSFDQFHRDNPAQMKWKWQLIRKLHQAGIKVGGRISHQDLAQEYLSAGVWAYPTEFPEINCMTAIKAGLAGCIPVTTGYAALQETVLEPQYDWGETIYNSKEAQDDFVDRMVKALKQGRTAEKRAKLASKYEKFSWANIAKAWDEAIR